MSLCRSYSVRISKPHEGIKFISNGAIGSIPEEVRSMIPLSPFLQAILIDTKDEGSGAHIEHGVVVVGRERSWLDADQRLRRRARHRRGGGSGWNRF